MKTTKYNILAVFAAIGLVAFSAQAQTNTTTSVPNLLGNIWDAAIGSGLTNLSETTYITYTPSIKKWGVGEVLTRNIPIGGGVSTGIGIGVDYYDSQFYAVNAQVGLSAVTKPFATWGGFFTNVTMTPFTFIGLGTPFGNNAQGSGNLETIAAVGEAIYITHVIGADLNILGIYGTRTGLDAASGTFYGAGLTLFWKF